MKQAFVNAQTGEIAEIDLTPDEIAEREAFQRDVLPVLALRTLRKQRNRLLAETDYLALADSTLTDDMRAYRQALRDLPANTADPSNPVWPIKPE